MEINYKYDFGGLATFIFIYKSFPVASKFAEERTCHALLSRCAKLKWICFGVDETGEEIEWFAFKHETIYSVQ